MIRIYLLIALCLLIFNSNAFADQGQIQSIDRARQTYAREISSARNIYHNSVIAAQQAYRQNPNQTTAWATYQTALIAARNTYNLQISATRNRERIVINNAIRQRN